MTHEEALRQIAAIQPRCLETLRSNGIVFNDLTDHWQKVAFSIYTDLCETETIATVALWERHEPHRIEGGPVVWGEIEEAPLPADWLGDTQ